MKSATFKYIGRGCKDLLVLIPGWAADYRIFDKIDLDFNYLLPLSFSPFVFEQALLNFLKENNIEKISLFGWSLGGFVAAEFASRHKGIVGELILVSIRKGYKKSEMDLVRKSLERNRRGYLAKFYTRCFPDRKKMRWFRENLMKPYCAEFNLSYLLDSLCYLADARIIPESLKGINKIKIVHGGSDTVAPIEEAVDIKKNIPESSFVLIEDAGHMPFLREDFKNLL